MDHPHRCDVGSAGSGAICNILYSQAGTAIHYRLLRECGIGRSCAYEWIWSGACVAIFSPFVAFVFGIGPQLLPIVPAIAAGNLVFVGILYWIHGSKPQLLRKALAWLGAALGKFAALYLLVVQLICNVLPLKQPQIDTFTAMFSLPQLITALIGGGIAILIIPALKKAVK